MKYVLKFLILLLWCMLAAYMVNISVKMFDPAERVSAPDFGWVYAITVVLMGIYVWMINWVYNEILSRTAPQDDDLESKLLVHYLLFAIVPPMFVHQLLLHVSTVLDSKEKVNFVDLFFNTTYWKEDFVFLLLPLLLTALFFYYYPQHRIFKNSKVRYIVERQVLRIGDWREYRNPHKLLEQLRISLGVKASVEYGRIRLFDIVFIVYENKSYFAILTNGDKCLLPRFEPKMLAQCPLGAWFVQIGDTKLINMLYVLYPIATNGWLTLDSTVSEVLFSSDGKYNTDLCSLERRGYDNVKLFLSSIPVLQDSGWKEEVVKVE